MLRVNIGCGQTPTPGWVNFDNSLSLRLARVPFLPAMLRSMHLLGVKQNAFIQFARNNNIQYGDATQGLPLPAESCEVIYSSHMLEHLDQTGAARFLEEAHRILCPGGIIRLVVPDIRHLVDEYNESGDADAFVKATLMCAPTPRSLLQRLSLLFVGTRHHLWMYDGESLRKLLVRNRFVDGEVLPVGETKILDPGWLDLREREAGSVYVEAQKPLE